MKAIIYIRKSTDREDKQKLSVEGQADACQEIAKHENLDVLEVIVDRQTAKKPWREGFSKMMQMIAEGKASHIICWKLDRLARNPIDAGAVSWALQNNSIHEIHSIDGVFRSSDNVLMLNIHFGMATQYVIDLKKNVERGMKQKLNKGGVVQKAPFGYRHNKNTWEVEIVPKEASLIRKAFEMRADGASYGDIMHFFELRWVKRSHSNIQYIITNAFYYGMMYFAGEYYKWGYETIVDYALFKKAGSVWRWFYEKKHHDKIFFRGIVKDLESWKPFTASVSKGTHVYYHEHSRDAKENNRKVRRISQKKILWALGQLIGQYKVPEEAKEQIRKACIDSYSNDFDVIFNDRKKQNSIIDEQLKKKQKMKELFSAGLIDTDELNEDFRIIRKSIADAEYELAQCHGSLEVLEKRSDEVVELLNILTGSYKHLADMQKAAFAKIILVELFVDAQGGLKIQQKEAFANLFCSENTNWLTDQLSCRSYYRWLLSWEFDLWIRKCKSFLSDLNKNSE